MHHPAVVSSSVMSLSYSCCIPPGGCQQQHFSLSVSQIGKFLGSVVHNPTEHAVTRKCVSVQELVARTLNRSQGACLVEEVQQCECLCLGVRWKEFSLS